MHQICYVRVDQQDLPRGVGAGQRGGEGRPGGDNGRVRGVRVRVAPERERGVQLGLGGGGGECRAAGLGGDVGDAHHRLVL